MRTRACPLPWATALAAALTPGPSPAGPVNPDISVIGDSRAAWSEAADDLEITFEELEVAFVGPVNPYASAEAYVAVHGTDELDIEEAKLLLDRYLPDGLGLTIGRFLQDFGQLNVLHSHAYAFVGRPRMHEEFFGEDGALDTGVRLDWIAPTESITLRATVGAVRGDLFLAGAAGHARGGGADSTGGAPDPEIGVTGRVDLFAEPSRDFFLLIGGSVLHGEHDPDEGAKATWFDVDAKARWDLGPNRALVLNAEGVIGSLDATTEAPGADPSGWFASADLRANRRWNLGGFAESATERGNDARTNRFGAFVGLALMEESTLFRVVARVTDPDAGDTETDVLVQTLFGLGPHRPHRY